ncbi:hypothetical protein SARC_05555 [Sphaeroforma arctica JP610]|uniref:Dickkopf N-terminal cysteine-rich domain-containing protein n=1 Tax=Sphaeroforma arctica JP610 TaxID=667725 RepID=A0A0L0G1U1_9EUKA|nr:hypothetical protein SARC_05555 [Sphaeroforma arctica JP610]KNC82153.1 hypothetical protein SARC_05555 [Sphaeroforma arctica JP610]|eukprot:XP_014156055.1 hypothetical protein SARC_05555 [Sphaeroforma arctica JP610]
MIPQIVSISLVLTSVQAVSARREELSETPGVPFVVDAGSYCGNATEVQCTELDFCIWKVLPMMSKCLEDGELIERVNNIACITGNEVSCTTDERCEWADGVCQGQYSVITVVSDGNGTVALDSSGFTAPPEGSMYSEVDSFCKTITDATTCNANQYCEYGADVTDDNCQGNSMIAEEANEIVCAPLHALACLGDLRCELEDFECIGGDSIIIVPTPE